MQAGNTHFYPPRMRALERQNGRQREFRYAVLPYYIYLSAGQSQGQKSLFLLNEKFLARHLGN